MRQKCVTCPKKIERWATRKRLSKANWTIYQDQGVPEEGRRRNIRALLNNETIVSTTIPNWPPLSSSSSWWFKTLAATANSNKWAFFSFFSTSIHKHVGVRFFLNDDGSHDFQGTMNSLFSAIIGISSAAASYNRSYHIGKKCIYF